MGFQSTTRDGGKVRVAGMPCSCWVHSQSRGLVLSLLPHPPPPHEAHTPRRCAPPKEGKLFCTSNPIYKPPQMSREVCLLGDSRCIKLSTIAVEKQSENFEDPAVYFENST